MALLFKRYFLKEAERENYEQLALELSPELNDKVFKLDDYEIKDLVENIKLKQLI